MTIHRGAVPGLQALAHAAHRLRRTQATQQSTAIYWFCRSRRLFPHDLCYTPYRRSLMAFKVVQPADVPAFAIVEERIKSVSSEISISETAYDFDRMVYCFRLVGPSGRDADLHLSRELLDDLRDNPVSPAGKYTIELTAKLDSRILETIEASGLISFSEESLKFLLLRFVAEEQKNRRTPGKYNTIGRGTPGDFERWLRTEITTDEKDSLIWAWNELMRLRLIAPTGTDLFNPDEWVKLTERGASAVERKTFTQYAEIEEFISKGQVYTAFRVVQRILQQARSSVIVIDPFVDEQVLDHVAALDPGIKVQIITEHVKGNFKTACRKLVEQRGNLEVRVAVHFHDRFIVLDGAACYQLGSSINHLGGKATVIDRKSTAVRDKTLSEFYRLWAGATRL